MRAIFRCRIVAVSLNVTGFSTQYQAARPGDSGTIHCGPSTMRAWVCTDTVYIVPPCGQQPWHVRDKAMRCRAQGGTAVNSPCLEPWSGRSRPRQFRLGRARACRPKKITRAIIGPMSPFATACMHSVWQERAAHAMTERLFCAAVSCRARIMITSEFRRNFVGTPSSQILSLYPLSNLLEVKILAFLLKLIVPLHGLSKPHMKATILNFEFILCYVTCSKGFLEVF